METVRSAVRFKGTRELSEAFVSDRVGEEDGPLENDHGFSPDVTYNYMIQLRDVLIMSDRQGWEILHASDAEVAMLSQRESSSLRRLRRTNPQLGQRSRSSSPFNSGPPELLLECIDILASVILEEGRFKTSSARLTRPPFGLQAACLDIAQTLIKTHFHDSKILSLIGFAVIPAFTSFDSALHTRLFTFFEDGILRGMLKDLQTCQSLDIHRREVVHLDHTSESQTPVVAIQVEEAADDSPQALEQAGWLQWSSTSSPIASSFLSAVAPSQPLVVYQLSSMIPPLLVAIFEAFNPLENTVKDIPKIYRFHTLLRTIVEMKRDAYLDVLEVVAYHGASTRRKALAMLATFWPKALGHVVIGKSLPIIGYSESVATQFLTPKVQFSKPVRDHPYAHEFLPWRFSSLKGCPSLEYGVVRNCCQSCSGPIIGFGLLCPFCFVGVHLNCYDDPHGTLHGEYMPSSETDPRPYFLSFSTVLPSRKDIELDIIQKEGHGFRLANLFTLSLCLVCHKPLWGFVKQGVKCVKCHQFVHLSCMPARADVFPPCRQTPLSPGHVFIDWSVLRQTFVDHYRRILLPEEELSHKSYEEVSIYYSVLWAQLRILDSGVSYRSIVVNQENPKTASAKENHVDEFELQYFTGLYGAYLSSGRLTLSAALHEHYDLNQRAFSNDHTILFDWSLLASITSIIKTPITSNATLLSSSSNLLHVCEPDVADPTDIPSHPYELATLSHMRNVLRHEFQIHSDYAAQYMLSHICQVGFFECVDLNNAFDSPAHSDVICSFPLPSGLDLSVSVETLVAAIEACLHDLDIAVNEHGFLLLVHRFAPTGAASEYALTRLTKIVLSWIFAEDDRLMIIIRDYVARSVSLPGVRIASDPPPWPSTPTGRYTTKTVANSGGGEYVMCRRQLLTRHAIPWLASVHDLDPALYANCLYDHCVDVSQAESPVGTGSLYLRKSSDPMAGVESKLACGEDMLRSMIKIMQANVAFSSFEQILVRWFDLITPPLVQTPVQLLIFKSLPRLFNHESDSSRRASTMHDVSHTFPDSFHVDPWKIFINIAAESVHGLERSLLWLRAMVYSAVDVPTQTLNQLFGIAHNFHAPFAFTVSLLESTMTSMWLRTFGGEGLDVAMVQLNAKWADELLFQIRSEDKVDEILDFLRYSLVTCLLVYGCERQTIVTLGLIRPETLRHMPQRRRNTVRTSAAPAVLEIDPQLVTILSRYVAEGSEPICALVAKFLSTLVSESALLESHEVDQFILVNGDALARCAWRFYGIESQDISDIRTGFLLRLLVVDSQPLDVLLDSFLQTNDKWRVRFQAITQLFQILLDINSPSFNVQDRQWRTSVVDVINHFFSPLWLDSCEDIRLTVDTWARTLLPAHLRTISACWDEYMSKAPIADRAKLASFLVQLHTHFPSWQVLSWETIVECLLDADFVQDNETDEDGYAAMAHPSVYGYPSPNKQHGRVSHKGDTDIISLRISLVILSLQLIADKVEVDVVSLLKIKFILAKVFGFTNTSLQHVASGQTFHVHFEDLPLIQEDSFSCINPLMHVLDAPHQVILSPSSLGVTSNDAPVTGLVGDVFVDLIAKLWENATIVQTLPYSALRGLLESMLLIIAKHELNSPSLNHLDELMCKAIKTVSELVTWECSYDIRHLCLAVMLAFLQGYPVLALKILGHQVLVLTHLAASLRFNTEDSLVLQVRDFLETAFVQYEVSGLFWLLSKQGRMTDEFFVILRHVVTSASTQTATSGETLRDSIVRDTLSKVAANANDRAIPDALHNLERYVAVCHHQSYPVSLIQHVGLRLTAIARQTADVTPSSRPLSGFDPNPLLLMSATIVQHNKSQCVDLLLHVETLLRAALVRFVVHIDTLDRLLHVTATIFRRSKTMDMNGVEVPMNHIAMAVLDVLSDSLKGKVHTLPATLAGMLEVIVSLHNNQNSYLPTLSVLRAGADAISHLSYPPYRETYGNAEFSASLAVADLILHASTHTDDTFLAQSLAGDTRSPSAVRVWNLVVLASLKRASPESAQKLLNLLPNFVMAYVSSLRLPLSGVLNESAAPSVNHAFASVKLWMLLARKAYFRENRPSIGQDASDSDNEERKIWNEMWPPFERLLIQSMVDGPSGEMPPLLTFVWGCVSDLMLFVRQARSVVALDTSSHMSILNKLRTSSGGEVAGGKFTRAQRSISEPPTDVSFEMLINQVSSDVLAAEKLQSIEVYRQGGYEKRREHAEKSRTGTRELRAVA
ncbi:hypothetical protein K439DRAFT_1382139 [Ramaria rubella]|nr:hypothetical protein K439DRAFT_1382139 [Ramaria rubella]